jgi:hypothetical protein
VQNLVQAASIFHIHPDRQQDHRRNCNLQAQKATRARWRLAVPTIEQQPEDRAGRRDGLLPRHHECMPILDTGETPLRFLVVSRLSPSLIPSLQDNFLKKPVKDAFNGERKGLMGGSDSGDGYSGPAIEMQEQVHNEDF